MPVRRLPYTVTLLFLLLMAGAWAAAPKIDIVIKGLDDQLRENVLSHLSLQRYRNAAEISEGRLRLLYRRGPEEIRTALQPFGYYQPKIQSHIEQTAQGWRATYRVTPGPVVRLNTVDIQLRGEGKDDPAFRKLVAELPLKKGEPLKHPEYEGAKNSLQSLAVERGYFDAQLTAHEVRVNIPKQQADVVLHFDTGPRYHFGQVHFQQEILSPDLLHRYLPFQPGDPYDSEQVLALQSALRNSNYFAEVTVAPQRQAAENQRVPIQVQLTPREPNRYTVGLGYGTDTGPRARLGWERRWVNRLGHSVRFDAEASRIADKATFRYIVPMKDPLVENVVYSAGYDKESTETSTSEIALLGIAYTHLRKQWHETLSLNYHDENYTVGTEAGTARLLMPGVRWTRVRAAREGLLRYGDRVELRVRGSNSALASSTSFVQSDLFGKLIQGTGVGQRVILRGELGYTWTDIFSKIPPSIRFFAGGDSSVRGYGYQTLGPKDSQGNVIGGKYLMVGSVEYEHRIKGNYSAAIFYDVGNAMNDLSLPLKHGAGFGFRWNSPVGPIRIDFATALSVSGNPWRIHLSIGPGL